MTTNMDIMLSTAQTCYNRLHTFYFVVSSSNMLNCHWLKAGHVTQIMWLAIETRCMVDVQVNQGETAVFAIKLVDW